MPLPSHFQHRITFSHVSQSASSLRAATSSWTHLFLMALWGTLWLCLLLPFYRPALRFPHKPRAECSPSSCTQSSWKSWPPSPRSTASHWTVLLRNNGSVLVQTTSPAVKICLRNCCWRTCEQQKTYPRSCLVATRRRQTNSTSTKHAHTHGAVMQHVWVIHVDIAIKYCFYEQVCMYTMFIFLASLEYFSVFPEWIWMIFICRWQWDYFEAKSMFSIYLCDWCK